MVEGVPGAEHGIKCIPPNRRYNTNQVQRQQQSQCLIVANGLIYSVTRVAGEQVARQPAFLDNEGPVKNLFF